MFALSYRTLDQCGEIFGWLMDSLGDLGYSDEQRNVQTRLVDKYDARSPVEDQRRITENFRQNTNLRCVCATVAFGMGVQVKDVRYVLYSGPPSSLMEYWQQVGRAGRDGEAAWAHMYCGPRTVNRKYLDKSMYQWCQSKGQCLRYQALKDFAASQSTYGGDECCNACDKAMNVHEP